VQTKVLPGASQLQATAATADIQNKVLLASLKHFSLGQEESFTCVLRQSHGADITFDILKGTLRACLYADF